MAKDIWAFVEARDGKPRKISLEAIGKGRQLATARGVRLAAVVIGADVGAAAEEVAKYGPDLVYVAEDERLKDYNTEPYTRVLGDLIKENGPAVVIFGVSVLAKDLAARLAARLGAALAGDVIGLEGDGELVATRPVYAGKAQVKLGFKGDPILLTIRPNVFPAATANGKSGEVIKVAPKLEDKDFRATVKETIVPKKERVDVLEADVIVSGGRGMKGPENYVILEKLADLLGAAVGASRAAVDAGWRPYSDQVGQTGKVVGPNLYIACGISGAIQHQVGMSSSKVIVAVNKDPDAPIFKICDYGIVGDLFEVVPAVTEEVKKRKG
ncbi:MAG TPA: electron transfer flavoprotein subunit alpha/FixB family protein [Bacillota bacterium]|jgi:electron transfer flavoprotein alpha subunit